MDASFYIAWACLIGVPPVAIGTFFFIRRRWPHALSRTVIGSTLAIVVIIGFAVPSISFISTLANVVCISIAYLAYCFLAASCWNIRLSAIRILALIIAAVPIGAGYVLGTIGFLALAFIVADSTSPPLQTTQMTKDLMCRVTGWGMAASDSGFIVHLYKRWPELPFVEREVSRIVFNETNPASTPVRASCTDALAGYAKNHSL